jgi:phosphoserine aminotransferase
VVAVIIRRALFEVLRQDIPKIWRYPVHAEAASLYCTPSTFAIATMYHVLQYAISIGGVPALQAANQEKARRLYAALDRRPELYRMPAEVSSRSLMNVVFRLPTKDLEARFLAEAARRDMVGLEGHAAVGGLRASIYNWVSIEDVDALVELIDDFRS